MRTLFQIMKHKLQAGQDLVLATVIASSGSTPRGAGSRMLIGKEGLLGGTIGGGSVEYRSIQIAASILEEKRSIEQSFQLNKEDVSNLGMICGGDVNVFFHFLSHEDPSLVLLSDKAEELFASRQDFWLISDLKQEGSLSLYTKEGMLYPKPSVPDHLFPSLSAHPTRVITDSCDYFAEQIGFSGCVYVFGGGHVSQKLIPALSAVNFRCIVLDDRKEFTDPALFPDAAETILCDFYHLDQSITITEEDFCCVLTRGHAYDTIVQAQLLRTPAAYIGVIGSSHKKAGVFQRLVEEFHIPEKELSRITSPIGLYIKAETPEEIAVSITGQLILTRAERKGLKK